MNEGHDLRSSLTMSELPNGSEVKGIFPFGASYWTRTAEIQTKQADGASLSFFLKVRFHYQQRHNFRNG